MKKIIMENINPPYSLHDMNITAFERQENKLTLRTQSGMVSTLVPLSQQVDGYVEFFDIDWDFSYVYIYHGFYGNPGEFTGKKITLAEFIDDFINAGFSVIDEYFGYNSTCFTGYLSKGGATGECTVRIYHKGDRVYTELEKLNSDI